MAKRILLFIMSLAILICAPSATAQTAMLDSYVREGPGGNLALRQQNFRMKKRAGPAPSAWLVFALTHFERALFRPARRRTRLWHAD
jgi:hypothetical protein